jgi:hypothetical protein
MRIVSNLVPVLPALLFASQLAVGEYPNVVQEKLESKYKITVVNAEGGVVTWGVTLVLKKSGLIAGGMSSCTNEYKDGKFGLASVSKTTCSKYGGFTRIPGINRIPGANAASAAPAEGTRPFVMGEKLYVTKIEITDSVNFELVSDPINDVIYKAEVRFPFPKGTAPDSAKVDQLASEIFTIAPDNPQGGGAAASGQAAVGQAPTSQTPAPAAAPPPAPEPQQPALAPIEPPPPPPDAPPAQPPTLSLGMTIDQVVAIFGQPKLILEPVKNKKIYTYPDFKVTFVDGKVSAIQ